MQPNRITKAGKQIKMNETRFYQKDGFYWMVKEGELIQDGYIFLPIQKLLTLVKLRT
jgi:hypothetical protein